MVKKMEEPDSQAIAPVAQFALNVIVEPDNPRLECVIGQIF